MTYELNSSMTKLEINRFGEMETFAKVVELGGFSAAARYYRKSPSAISKLITRLEVRLNTRLFKRSTRSLQITEEGNIFYERSIRVLSDLEEAEQSVLTDQTPAGHLRLTTNIPIGRFFLLPIIPEFIKSHPKISFDITLTDKVIDLMGENIDIAIRSGPMKNSGLMARKLGETSMIIVGSPSYIKSNGAPKIPSDLAEHNLMRLNFSRMQEEWPFLEGGNKITINPSGNIEVSDGESMRQLVLSGIGLARLASFQVKNDINAGRLVPLLENYNPGDTESLYAVFHNQGGFLPVRIRAFIDFLVARIKL